MNPGGSRTTTPPLCERYHPATTSPPPPASQLLPLLSSFHLPRASSPRSACSSPRPPVPVPIPSPLPSALCPLVFGELPINRSPLTGRFCLFCYPTQPLVGGEFPPTVRSTFPPTGRRLTIYPKSDSSVLPFRSIVCNWYLASHIGHLHPGFVPTYLAGFPAAVFRTTRSSFL